MSLTIQLPSSIEQQIRENASLQGLSLERYVAQTLLSGLSKTPKNKGKKLLKEEDLLQLVRLNVQPSELEEYYRLIKSKENGTLTEVEYVDLISLTNRVEIAHAERMKYVIQLANLRGMSLEQTFLDLGLQRN
jgi:hypothetical protein